MSEPAASDVELIARAAAGESAAFSALLERHAPAMRRLARAVVGSDGVADDALQDAALAAFRGAASYSPGAGEVRPWLLAVTRNAARRALRGREDPTEDGPLLELGLRAGWGMPTPEQLVGQAEEQAALARALAALPAADREVIVLRELEELSGEQAAALLGVGVAAMKSRLHRARLRLLAELRGGQAPPPAPPVVAGGVDCGVVLGRLGAYLDRELSVAALAEVEAHVAGCLRCGEFGGRYAATVARLRERLRQPSGLDPEVRGRLRAALGGT